MPRPGWAGKAEGRVRIGLKRLTWTRCERSDWRCREAGERPFCSCKRRRSARSPHAHFRAQSSRDMSRNPRLTVPTTTSHAVFLTILISSLAITISLKYT